MLKALGYIPTLKTNSHHLDIEEKRKKSEGHQCMCLKIFLYTISMSIMFSNTKHSHTDRKPTSSK